jgi:hypothetical protein
MPRRKVAAPSEVEGKKYLAVVAEEYVFWCRDGQVFRSMVDLAGGLDAMSDEVFSYHSNEDKNDFARWTREVIGDESLASELARARGRLAAAAAVHGRVVVLSRT